MSLSHWLSFSKSFLQAKERDVLLWLMRVAYGEPLRDSLKEPYNSDSEVSVFFKIFFSFCVFKTEFCIFFPFFVLFFQTQSFLTTLCVVFGILSSAFPKINFHNGHRQSINQQLPMAFFFFFKKKSFESCFKHLLTEIGTKFFPDVF